MIQPLGLYTSNGVWYCPAFCHLKNAVRLFRMDRVKEFKLYENQSIKKDLKKITIHNWFRNSFENKKEVNLKVQLTRGGVRKIESEQWIYEHLRVKEDGSATLEKLVKEEEVDFLCEFFLGLGLDANVEGPDVLVNEIKMKLGLLLEQYNSK